MIAAARRPDRPVEPAHFRRVLGHFCSGVTVITGECDGRLAGMTCQSFFSVSLDPPLVAFSPSRTSTTYPDLRRAGLVCINILASDQEALGLGFSRSGADKFAGVRWRRGSSGVPVLEDVHAYLECRIEAEHEAGDHFIVVGRVLDLEVHDRRPLLFYGGQFATLSPAAASTSSR